MFQPIDNELLPNEPSVLAIGCDEAACQMLKAAVRQLALPIERFASLKEFLEPWQADRRGCIFVSLEDVGVASQEVVQCLAEKGICLPVILLAPRGSRRGARAESDVATATRAVRDGAFDFLPKPWSRKRLAQAAGEAIQWEADHRPEILERAMIEIRLARLDEKEVQMLGLIVQGMSNAAISAFLRLSTRAVEDRRKSLMEKMRAKNQVDLLRQAIAAGVGWHCE